MTLFTSLLLLSVLVISYLFFLFHNSCLSLLLFGVHAFVSLISADVVLLVLMKTCQNLSLLWVDQNHTNTDVPPPQVYPPHCCWFFGLGSHNTCSLEACEILRCAERAKAVIYEDESATMHGFGLEVVWWKTWRRSSFGERSEILKISVIE